MESTSRKQLEATGSNSAIAAGPLPRRGRGFLAAPNPQTPTAETLTFTRQCRIEIDDPARVVVPSESAAADGPSDLSPSLTSTRQCCRIEIAVSHSKHQVGTQSTRQFSAACPSPIFQFPFSNFAPFSSEKGVKPCQVFSPVSYSKQTIEVQKGCQFFAMCFSTGRKSQIAEPA